MSCLWWKDYSLHISNSMFKGCSPHSKISVFLSGLTEHCPFVQSFSNGNLDTPTLLGHCFPLNTEIYQVLLFWCAVRCQIEVSSRSVVLPVPYGQHLPEWIERLPHIFTTMCYHPCMLNWKLSPLGLSAELLVARNTKSYRSNMARAVPSRSEAGVGTGRRRLVLENCVESRERTWECKCQGFRGKPSSELQPVPKLHSSPSWSFLCLLQTNQSS